MKKIFIILSVSILLFGCAKENSEVFVAYPAHPLNDTNWVMEVSADAPANKIAGIFLPGTVVDSFNASTFAVLNISPELDIAIPAGTAYLNGTAVTGMVKLEVTQLNKKGDYIRAAKATTSFGKVLLSSGAFLIKASQNGQELTVKPGGAYHVTFRDPNPLSNMSVFYGQENLQLPLPAGTNPLFTWAPAFDSSLVITFVRQDTFGVVKGYQLTAKKFDWINIEKRIDSTEPTTTITAILPANYTNANTVVYAVFKQYKTVVQLQGNYLSKTFTAPNIPINSDIVLVSVTSVADDLYLGTKEVTVTGDLATQFTPQLKTKAEINQFLDSL